jgi:ribosomal protein S18 acetylase RimI-like enzyme
MVQSSITAWLKKPAVVKKADEPTLVPLSAPKSVPKPSPPAPAGENAPPESKSVPEETERPQVLDVREVSTPQMFSLPPLPPNVELVPLTEELMPGFKRLTTLTLPIAYPPKFYAESLTDPHHSVTLMALWRSAPTNSASLPSIEKPRLIGAIRCRVLPAANLYIATISLLAPYRSHGIATHLLQRIVAKASEEHGVKNVTAHVWEANEEGLEWYKKRGFEIIGKEAEYYKKLKPSGAVLVRKCIGVADLLANADTADKVEGR